MSPLFPIKVMIMLYRTSDAEEMKSIINRTRNMQQENPRRPYDHTVQKRKPPIWNDVHANFLVWDWNDICNGIIVIRGKEVVDWLVS